MKKYLLPLIIALQLCTAASLVHAQTSPGLAVTPAVIDEKAKPRDILKENITVKNTTNRTLQLYPSVNDVNSKQGEQAFVRATDSVGLVDSLANWIELSRGMVQVNAGEEKSIPFIIRVNLSAVPGSYHALISLTEGGTRAEADSKPPFGTDWLKTFTKTKTAVIQKKKFLFIWLLI